MTLGDLNEVRRRSDVPTTAGSVVGKLWVSAILVRLIIVLLLLAVTDGFALFGSNESLQSVHCATAGALAIACLLTAAFLVRADPETIWSPVPWFLLACGVYFGIGPEVYHWGTYEAIAYVDAFWPASSADLVKTHLLVCIGMSSALAGTLLIYRWLENEDLTSRTPDTPAYLPIVTAALLVVGLLVEYQFVLPYLFGSLSFVLPGSVMMLRYCVPVSVVYMVVLAATRSRLWLLPLCAVFVSELLVSVLEFSKTDALIDCVTLFFGVYLISRGTKFLAIGAASIAAVYLFLVPLVSFGRSEISIGNVSFYDASLSERLEILGSFLRGQRTLDQKATQDWWIRLNYVPAQAFAMHEYDSNRPIAEWRLALYVFVPRLLWPNKPAITDVSRDFNYLVNEDATSSSGPGVFAAGYYSSGWIGVICLSFIAGTIIGAFAVYSKRCIRRNDLIFLPVVLLGINVGTRVDGWFAADYVGPAGLATCAHMALWACKIFFDRSSVRMRATTRELPRLFSANG